MFVAIAQFPDVPEERDRDFREWFARSNDMVREVPGLKARRLLRAGDGSYVAIVEHESASTFAAMHAAEPVSTVHAQLNKVLAGAPRGTQYEVVIDSAMSSCCSGDGRRGHHNGPVGSHHAESPESGGCCHGA